MHGPEGAPALQGAGATRRMPWQEQSCQKAGGDGLARLVRFRQEMLWCLWRRPDALFELADSVLTAAGPVVSLPYLSLEPGFRRGHGMVYQSLAEGGIDDQFPEFVAAKRWQDRAREELVGGIQEEFSPDG